MAAIETLYWLYNRTNEILSGTVDYTRDMLDFQQFISPLCNLIKFKA